MRITLLCATLFLTILWPTFIALKLGALPGMRLDRIVLLLLFFVFMQSLITKNMYRNRIISRAGVLWWIMLIMLLWLLVGSIFISEDSIGSIYQVLNWFVSGPLIFFSAVIYLNKKSEIKHLFIWIFVALFICNLLGLLELFLQKALFSDYLISVTDTTLKASEEKSRGGRYRLKSVFSNPLVYAQCLLVCIVVSICIFRISASSVLKKVALFNILLSIILIYFTGSRAGVALGVFIPILPYFLSMLRGRSIFSPAVFYSIIILVGVSSIFVVYQYIASNYSLVDNLAAIYRQDIFDQSEISTLARVLQFKLGVAAFLDKPFTGYGMGQSLVNLYPLRSIDNYYLTWVLSAGLVGILLYLAFFGHVVKESVSALKKSRDPLLLASVLAIILIALYYLILSIGKADIFLYLFSAIVVIYSRALREGGESRNARYDFERGKRRKRR